MPAPEPVKSRKSHDREIRARRRNAIDLQSIRSLQCGFTAFFACVSVGYDQRTEDCDYWNCCCSAAFHVFSPVAYGFPKGPHGNSICDYDWFRPDPSAEVVRFYKNGPNPVKNKTHDAPDSIDVNGTDV